MSSFNKNACIIRKLYCGEGKIPKDTVDKKYSRSGGSYECLKKGYGIADWEHRKKELSKNSLQQIMYVGPEYEKNFRKFKIYSIKSLLSKTASMSTVEKRELLNTICRRKNGTKDQKAFNSIVLFLYEHGQKQLPSCRVVKE